MMDILSDDVIARLREALDRDQRTDRAISLEAGFGPNYLRGIYKEGKEPSFENLVKILQTLMPSDAVTVLTGLKLDASDLEFIELLSEMPPEAKQNAIDLFRTLLNQP